MNEGGAKQLEYYSRLCENECERSSFNVKCVTFDVMSRKSCFWMLPQHVGWLALPSEVASELQLDEQAVCQDLLGELSCSLSGMRKELRKWEKTWRQVFISHKAKSSTFICCQERELCGFVHDRFITFDSDSVRLMCIEARLKEKLDFEWAC